MNQDDNFMDQLRSLRNDRAPEELYRRITTVVPNMRQAGPPERRGGAVLRFFWDWQYGIALKFASFVLAALMGFHAGQAERPAQEHGFFSTMITGDIGWEE